jgi:hypothetical protein
MDTDKIINLGFLAEFESPEALVEAAEKTHAEGFRDIEAYSPFPIEELHHALHMPESKIPLLVLLGGIGGGLMGFGLQYFISVIAYPINVGGKPLNSWPAFIPVTFELTILGAALVAVFSMLALNKLPMPYHPLFNVERFSQASKDRFFLYIRSKDKQFDKAKTKGFLESLRPYGVYEVNP